MKTIEQLREEAIGLFWVGGEPELLMRMNEGKVDTVRVNPLGMVGYGYNIPIEVGKVQLCDVTKLRVIC